MKKINSMRKHFLFIQVTMLCTVLFIGLSFSMNKKNEEITNAKCTICLEKIEKNPKHLRCKHVFHKKCIDKWLDLDKKNACPNCRKDPITGENQPVNHDLTNINAHNSSFETLNRYPESNRIRDLVVLAKKSYDIIKKTPKIIQRIETKIEKTLKKIEKNTRDCTIL